LGVGVADEVGAAVVGAGVSVFVGVGAVPVVVGTEGLLDPVVEGAGVCVWWGRCRWAVGYAGLLAATAATVANTSADTATTAATARSCGRREFDLICCLQGSR